MQFSNDGAIKIWGYDKVLLTEIWLDDSLTCHIYIINRLTVLSQLAHSSDESEPSEPGMKISVLIFIYCVKTWIKLKLHFMVIVIHRCMHVTTAELIELLTRKV